MVDMSVFEKLLDFDRAKNVVGGGPLVTVCGIGLGILSLVFIFRAFKILLRDKGDLSDLWTACIDLAIVAALINPVTYKGIYELFYPLAKTLNYVTFDGESVQNIRIHIQWLLETLWNNDSLSKFINPKVFISSVDVLLFSLSINMFIVAVYVIMALPMFLYVFAILFGPIALAFGVLFPQLRQRWTELFFSSFFLGLFAGVVMSMVIGNLDMIALSKSINDGQIIKATVNATVGVCLLGLVPLVHGTIFGSQVFSDLLKTSMLAFLGFPKLMWKKGRNLQGVLRKQ